MEGRGGPSTTLAAAGSNSRRVALVIVHSRYTGWPALAGAAFDADRVGKALTAAGYKTTVVVDPSRSHRAGALKEFARRSAQAEVADFQDGWREDKLAQHAIKVSDLGKSLKAKNANLLLFGGCRDYFVG